MTAEEKENKKSISAAEYIRTTFHSSDRLAVLVRNRSRGETIQRITTSARIVEPAFQEWMHFKNEKESCDIYVGMNTLKPEARTRTKEDIQTIRHLYVDIDHDGPAALAKFNSRISCRRRTTPSTPHQTSFRWSGESRTFHRSKPRFCSALWRESLEAIRQRQTPLACSSSGLSEQEVRHRVSGARGEAHRPGLSSARLPAPHRAYRK